jgi:hypothetical protein
MGYIPLLEVPVARAEPVLAPDERSMVQEAGEATLLMVNRAMWETLVRQARAEGRHPGEVLNDALRRYLESEGAPEAIEYLTLVGTPGAHGGAR